VKLELVHPPPQLSQIRDAIDAGKCLKWHMKNGKLWRPMDALLLKQCREDIATKKHGRAIIETHLCSK